MKRVIFLTLVVWPLIQQAVHSVLQDDSLRRLHEQDWPVWEAAAVFPDESMIAELALPGSHPIRPRNQHRRRRKRPHPQTSQEEDATQLVPNQPLQNYQVSESPESDPITEVVSYIPTREPNFQHQTHRRRPAESLHGSSQEETESQSYEHKNNFTPKRPRGHKNEYHRPQEPEMDSEIINDSFKAYSSESSEAPQDLKALLKQHSGSLSLSEILQQKNLSLADLLKGNRNALSAISGTQDEPPPPRRLPSLRAKLQNADNQRPQRYSGNQSNLNKELTREVTVQRRLPPPRQKQALSDIRFRDIDTQERINKFVPSAPRRTSTASSTESIQVTNSIISDFKQNPVILVQNEKKSKASDEEVSINSSTEYNEIIPQTSESAFRTTDNDIQSTRSQIPLAIQETSVIDPISNVPQEESLKRLRAKYLPRHRVSPAQSDAPNRFRLPITSSTEEPKTHESTQNNFVLEKDISSTVKPEKTLDISTVQPQKIEDSSETEVEQDKPTDAEIPRESSDVKIEEINDDYGGNIIPGKLDINVPDESKTQENSHHEDDGPMYKVIPLNTEIPNIPPSATSARDEILEFLKTDMGSIRLARILASRNMTLAELIDHRERGSSQQHLAEIFKEDNQPNIQESESQADKTNPNQNDDMHRILKHFQHTNSDIPSIQEMFGFLNDHHGTTDNTNTSILESSDDSQVDPNKHSESQEEQIPSENKNIFPGNLPTFPPQKPPIPIQNPHTVSPWKRHQTPPIYSFEPINPYVNPAGQRSRLTSIPPSNMGQVEELGNNNYRDFGDDLEDEVTDNSGLPQDVKSAIIVSSAILGVAIMGFLSIFVVCRWKQKRARRRFVDGIINTRARSPILMQPDGKNPAGGINPIMISSNDLYTRDLSINSDPATRKYYLWRTIRKTLRYK